jgi:hypothetical protein
MGITLGRRNPTDAPTRVDDGAGKRDGSGETRSTVTCGPEGGMTSCTRKQPKCPSWSMDEND